MYRIVRMSLHLSIVDFTIATIICLFLLYGISGSYGSATVYGNSMSPTFNEGDVVDYDLSFRTDEVKRGSIVVFHSDEEPNVLIIKRVVGIESDYIEIEDNELYVNKSLIPYDLDLTQLPYFIHYKDTYVGEGEVYVVGDNQSNSFDSRNYGCVPIKNVIGIVKE